jgi:hypothetical protein
MDERTSSLLQPRQNVVHLLNQFAYIGSLITILIGILCLLSWQFTIFSFIQNSFSPTSVMNPLSGIGFILSGCSLVLLLQQKTQNSTSKILVISIQILLSSLTALIGLIMILTFIGTIHVNLDQILFSNKLGGNRISPNSSINFFFIGTALLLLQFHTKKYFTRTAQIVTLVASIISMFAVIGYIYHALSLYKFPFLAPMPLSSALTFSIFCLSLLFARSDHGITKILTRNTPSSTFALRLIGITLTLPAILSYLLVLCEQQHLFDAPTEMALLVIGNIILLSIIIWINTRVLQHIELENLLIKNELEQKDINLEVNAKELAAKTLSLEEENREFVDKLETRDKLLDIEDEEE